MNQSNGPKKQEFVKCSHLATNAVPFRGPIRKHSLIMEPFALLHTAVRFNQENGS